MSIHIKAGAIALLSLGTVLARANLISTRVSSLYRAQYREKDFCQMIGFSSMHQQTRSAMTDRMD
jgi:hypothetical protein